MYLNLSLSLAPTDSTWEAFDAGDLEGATACATRLQYLGHGIAAAQGADG